MARPRATRPVDIYVRVSRVGDRKGDSYTSPDEQEREARRFAKNAGIPLSGVVIKDENRSGGTLDRPGLQEALGRVESGVSGGIIVAYLSRLSRDTEQGLELLREISEVGGAVYAPNLPDYETADGQMLTTIQLAIDTNYRKRKRDELEVSKERAIQQGVPIHSRPPVGYLKRGATKSDFDRQLVPDRKTANIVRKVFEMRAAGAGPASIGTFLAKRGVKTSQGSETWSKQAVYGLLRNRIYLGELSYGNPPRYVNAESHEPLVDEALWIAAQGQARTLAPARTKGSEFLITGLARCAGCRYCLQATTTSHGHRIYRCTRTHAAGICPNPTRVRAEGVEDIAVQAFWQVTENLEAVGQPDDDGVQQALEVELAKADAALKQWASPEVQEAIGDLAEYAQGLRTRRQAREAVMAKLAAQRSSKTSSDLPDAKTLRDAWQRMKVSEKRELLSLRFDCFAIARNGSGGTLVPYLAGTAPADLPRRGFKASPVLAPFPDVPDGAWVLTF